MRLHANAELSLKRRGRLARLIVDEGWSVTSAAAAADVTRPTARKWAQRYRQDGEAGLVDRPSTPRRIANKTPDDRIAVIAALRRVRLTGPEIAQALGMACSTVSGVLAQIGLGKLSRLEPPEPANRYERRTAGELLHIDVKKLGRIGPNGAGHRVTGTRGPGQRSRGAGWEYVHVCVDDATRLAYVEVLADEKATTAVGFLRRAIAYYRRLGITVCEVMTDNGPAYVSFAHSIACRALGLRHIRTRPYRPRTNGKAERFIRTMLGGWAYGAIYASSHQRTAALTGWLDFYNHHRPHRSLNKQPPLTRLHQLSGNNLLGTYT